MKKSKPLIIPFIRNLVIGKPAPKGSRFKGIITTETILGDNSYWDYLEKQNILDNNKSSNFKNYFDYTNKISEKETNNIYTHTHLGAIKTKEQYEEFKKNERKYIVNGNTVFDFVISLESLKAAEKYNLFDCKDWYDKVDLLIPKIAKEFYLNKEDINFKCNYEINEKKIDTDNIQPHIHLTFWFNKNFKQISTINKKTFKNIKKHIHNIFIENEFDTINILEKNLYINEINQSLKLLKNDFQFSLKNEEIKNEINNFLKKLNSQGRLQYNSFHLKEHKKELDTIVKNILTNTSLKKYYEKYLKDLENYDTKRNENIGVNVYNLKETKLEELYEHIGNKILRLKKINQKEKLNVFKLQKDFPNLFKKEKIINKKFAHRGNVAKQNFDEVLKNNFPNLFSDEKNKLKNIKHAHIKTKNILFNNRVVDKTNYKIKNKLETELEKFLKELEK